MTNLTALQSFIEGTPALLSMLQAGSNAELVTALNEPDGANNVAQLVSRDVVLGAIGDGLRGLDDASLQKLRILLTGEQVDFRVAAVRDEIREIFSANQIVLDRLTVAASRQKLYADRFDTERIGLADVRAVAKRVSTSYYNKYMRGEV